MGDSNTSIPYERLGFTLKRLREQHRESLAEVSGAVEINENDLTRIEAGHDRPAEEILMLLISHFGIEDDNASELWQLAGYDNRTESPDRLPDVDAKQRIQAMVLMLDPRIVYSDNVEVVANQQGVVMNFSQPAGLGVPPVTVSRIGMSHEQAKAVIGILHQVLYNHENPGQARRLGDGSEKKD